MLNLNVLSGILNQPGLIVGMGLGVCIGFVLGGNLTKQNDERNFNCEDYNEGEFNIEDIDNTKLILVARTDLKMGKGKLAAQCCHATLKAYQQIKRKNPQLLRVWELSGQPKVVVKSESEENLLELAARANSLGLITSLIQDAGRTQIAPGSKTVLAVGPGPGRLIDEVTGHLKLY